MSLDPQKEKMLERWYLIKNAILRAAEGELIVKYMRESDFQKFEGGEAAAVVQKKVEAEGEKIVGLYIDMILKFPSPVDEDFTPEEIKQVEELIAKLKQE
jgi:hypothetical protein